MGSHEAGNCTSNPKYAEEEVAATKGQPVGEKKKKTRLVRVRQEVIDVLLKMKIPQRRYRPMTQEFIDRVQSREARELCAIIAVAEAQQQALRDQYADILGQYHLKGYAMLPVEVKDGDDEEDEVVDMADVVGMAVGN